MWQLLNYLTHVYFFQRGDFRLNTDHIWLTISRPTRIFYDIWPVDFYQTAPYLSGRSNYFLCKLAAILVVHPNRARSCLPCVTPALSDFLSLVTIGLQMASLVQWPLPLEFTNKSSPSESVAYPFNLKIVRLYRFCRISSKDVADECIASFRTVTRGMHGRG